MGAAVESRDTETRPVVVTAIADVDLREAVIAILDEFGFVDCVPAPSLADAATAIARLPAVIIVDSALRGDVRAFIDDALRVTSAVILMSTRTPTELNYRTNDVEFLQLPIDIDGLLAFLDNVIRPPPSGVRGC